MNQTTEQSVATIQPQRKSSLLEIMAARYNMDPQTFATTVRKTAMPSNATNEEFAAFMMVAKEYNLNPILKEIHAFPKKGGGIQPIVSIDGWISLVNQHPQCDGYEFEWQTAPNGDPISCKCTMHRRDRKHPVVVEEFLSECYRPTDPWKMKHRMLRHKALMQAARYAFGFSGIMDQEEAETIGAMRDITPPPRPQMSEFSAAQPEQGAQTAATGAPAHDAATGEIIETETNTDDGAGDLEGDGPSPADAYQLGEAARDAQKPRRVPPEIDNQGSAFSAAWLSGWDAADGRLTKSRKAQS